MFLFSGSLRNLTEKVQKEVERAEEMDKNILKSLESDSRGASFIDEFLKISSSLSDHLKRILFKMLQEGPEVKYYFFYRSSNLFFLFTEN